MMVFHISSAPPIRGKESNTVRTMAPIQKEPLTLLNGLKIRKSNKPAVKEKSSLEIPPVNSEPVSEYPTQISPVVPHIENLARLTADTSTTNVSAQVCSLRIKKA